MPLLIYTLILTAAALASLGLAILAWFRREVPGARYFMLGNLFLLFYILGTIMEIRARSPEEILLWLALEYLGIATVGPFWVLVIRGACQGKQDWSVGYLGLFFAVPVLVVIAVSSNDLHHLFYTTVTFRQNGGFTVPFLSKGPLYLLNFVYMNLCLFFASMIILSRLVRAPRAYRNQLMLLLAGSLFPWGGMVLYQLGLSPWGLDLAPLGLTGSCLIFGYALFRFQLFDLSPLLVDRVLDCMHEGVLVLDTKQRLVGLNPAMEGMAPGLDHRSLGQDAVSLGEQNPDLRLLLEKSRNTQVTLHDRHYQVDRAELRDRRNKLQGTILLLTDVTERVSLAERLFEASRTDELTGIPNRRSFHESAAREIDRLKRYGGKLALIILDIDHFKATNDTWGHQTGDQVLIHVTRTCGACLRPSDHLTRYGGEEFAVLLPGADLVEAETVAERMRRVLEESEAVIEGPSQPDQTGNPGKLRVTASFGCTALECTEAHEACKEEPGQAALVDRLVRKADDAMYQAKASGRNTVCKVEWKQPGD